MDRRDVLDTLARTLRLSEAEHRHLRTLAEPPRGSSVEDPWSAGPPSALARFVDALDPAPAYVLGPAWQILAHNRAHARLAPMVDRVDEADRNLLWLVFAGTLTFEHQRFRPVEWPELWVSGLLPLPGDDSAERLAAWRQVG